MSSKSVRSPFKLMFVTSVCACDLRGVLTNAGQPLLSRSLLSPDATCMAAGQSTSLEAHIALRVGPLSSRHGDTDKQTTTLYYVVLSIAVNNV